MKRANLIVAGTVKRQKESKNTSVARILKAAYRPYFRDKNTRLAVKRCLG